jgi:hypothetical protein
MYKFHKDHTEPTNLNAVFVFGSNLAAKHGGGAALLAEQKYGASPDVPEGLSGSSYAIPTKSKRIETLALSTIKASVDRFIEYAKANPSKEFFMTRIGCVLAGYENKDIAPMFKDAPANIDFPEEWKEFLTEEEMVMVLRTVDKDGKAHGGFQWPEKGKVVCPDWNPRAECGNGLHGVVFPDGEMPHIINHGPDEKWQVVQTAKSSLVDLDGKVKFPECEVIYTGNMAVAITMVANNWNSKLQIELKKLILDGKVSKEIASGYSSKAASSGDSSTAASSGNYSTAASSGYSSTAASSGVYSKAASSGDSSTAEAKGKQTVAMVAGLNGRARAGINGAFALPWLDGDQVRIAVGIVGENAEADVWYKVEDGVLVKAG